MYDIIGDVHGQADFLKKLLLKLGYSKNVGGFSHPSRKAIFVGDFINRGNEIRQTIHIIREMVEAGNAVAILGNHEINAIIYHIKDEFGLPLIKKHSKYSLPLIKTLNEFHRHDAEWKSHRKWFRTLPVFFENDGIRVVHAYWSDSNINILKAELVDNKIKKSVFRKISKNSDSVLGKSLWQTVKGVNLELPRNLKILDNKGVSHRSFRIKWWEPSHDKTFEELSFESKFKFPSYTVPKEIIPAFDPYPEDAPIVFFGHYCRFKGPFIVRDNVCCVDSCVPNSKKLTAYSWDGEVKLKKKHLISAT